jgi:hypothetical protein
MPTQHLSRKSVDSVERASVWSSASNPESTPRYRAISSGSDKVGGSSPAAPASCSAPRLRKIAPRQPSMYVPPNTARAGSWDVRRVTLTQAHSCAGNAPLRPRFVQHGWLRLDAGLRPNRLDLAPTHLRRGYDTAGLPQITSHTFRRSVATAMDHAGLTARMAADQLGHQKISMTTDTYYARRTPDTGAATILEVLAD